MTIFIKTEPQFTLEQTQYTELLSTSFSTIVNLNLLSFLAYKNNSFFPNIELKRFRSRPSKWSPAIKRISLIRLRTIKDLNLM